MANFLDKIKVKTAVDKRTQQDLSSFHVTTANFMQFNVAFSRELVPGQSIKVQHNTFARLQPLPVPTYGRAKIQNRAFFVPFRIVFPAFNDFISDAAHITSSGQSVIYTSVPKISSQVLTNFFAGVGYSDLFNDFDYTSRSPVPGQVDSNTERYDFITTNGEKILLSKHGRYCMKILQSLGYQVMWERTDGIASTTDVKYSALPLLCLAKVYADWYYPSLYLTNPYYSMVDAIFNRDNGNTELELVDLYKIFDFISSVNYSSDYFTSAWENPVGPNNQSSSPFDITDPTLTLYNGITRDTTTNSVTTAYSNNTTPYLEGAGENDQGQTIRVLDHITQYSIDALKALTDYMKRHQIVGGRTLDRYLSRFGVKLSDEVLKRSTYVGSSEENIQFGDVMSQSATEGAKLGDYAGKGLGYNEGVYSYDNDKEYGMFIVVSTIMPQVGYYQGIDRNVMHLTKTDYWTPEFDQLGVQAISRAELYVGDGIGQHSEDFQRVIGLDGGNSDYYQRVFGFVPRYAEYKICQDRLTGDFRYHSINTGMDSWHTMRTINPSSPDDVVISEQFISGEDASQYTRIFDNTDDAYDKFIIIHNFDVKSSSPFASYWDNYEFESKGNDVIMQANGVKFN